MHFFHSSDLKTAVGNGELLFFFFFLLPFFISSLKANVLPKQKWYSHLLEQLCSRESEVTRYCFLKAAYERENRMA